MLKILECKLSIHKGFQWVVLNARDVYAGIHKGLP